MKTIEDGHVYEMLSRTANGRSFDPIGEHITFLNREPGHEHSGTTTQEVLRVLIDRTQYCDHCLPWSGNKLVVHHLRMALALHEARALIRKVETGELEVERMMVGLDGHLTWSGYSHPRPAYAFPDEQEPTETGSLAPGKPCHTPIAAE